MTVKFSGRSQACEAHIRHLISTISQDGEQVDYSKALTILGILCSMGKLRRL